MLARTGCSAVNIVLTAGEPSGDYLAAGLLRALRKKLGSELKAFGMGGPALRREPGFYAWADIQEASVSGIRSVAFQYPRLLRLLKRLVDHIEELEPKIIVMVDFPDFHYRLASCVRNLKRPVIQYAGPSVWAWRPGRVLRWAEVVDEVLVLFPFELDPWQKGNVSVTWVGHPVFDEHRLLTKRDLVERDVWAIFPGSRKNEIQWVLPRLLDAVRLMTTGRFILPVASEKLVDSIERLVHQAGVEDRVEFIDGCDREATLLALNRAQAAAVCSGTATLEVALSGCPQVVVYQTDFLSWRIMKALAQIKYISLPNLLAKEPIVPELLQSNLSGITVKDTLLQLASGSSQLAYLEPVFRRARIEGAGAFGQAADAVLRHI